MEYQVPQFIEVEDKLVGPLTLKQFIYIAGGGGICVIAFAYLPIIAAFAISALVAAFTVALAFYKVNGKPFISMLEAGVNYYLKGKLFLWKHGNDKIKKEDGAAAVAAAAAEASIRSSRSASKLTQGKLSELAFSLDVRDPNSAHERQ